MFFEHLIEDILLQRTLKPHQRKNTQLISLIQVFWVAPCFPDLTLPTPGQERLSSAKALRGLYVHAGIQTGQAGGEMIALQALDRELQRWVGYLKVSNAMHVGPRQSSFLWCSHTEWEVPAWNALPLEWVISPWRTNVPHTMEKVTSALVLLSLSGDTTTLPN